MAGFFAGLAAFTRIPGALLVIPLLWAAWNAWQAGDKRGWLAPAIALIGTSFFPLYVWCFLHTSPLSILQALNKRGGSINFPGKNIIEAGGRILNGQLIVENLTELVFTIFLVIMAVYVWKKLPRIYGIYTASLVIFFLARFGYPQPLISMTRYTLEIFPIFILLALLGNSEWRNRIILYLSLPGLLFFSAQFAIWGWVG